ncbi:MAG TPA: type II secretion system protein [Tepidisphaeraceae bacterium]|jgi:hypothetical protein|nr:type II secretion system protein [Tepidisphaeraceae bacterium]
MTTSLPSHRRHRGFTFAEILFAVMILGIGFIMVAAIFPVAILQQQATVEATDGNSAARNGSPILLGTQYMTSAGLPPTAIVYAGPAQTPAPPVLSFYDSRYPVISPITPSQPASNIAFWNSIKGSLIVPGAEQLGFVPVYSRVPGSSLATLYVFAVQCRNASAFTDDDVEIEVANTDPNLAAKKVSVTVTDGGSTQPDTITISSAGSNNFQAAVENAYVIISDDGQADLPATPANEQGEANGRIARLGTFVSSTATTVTYQLAPGSDLVDTVARPNEALSNATAFIIGRGYTNPKTPSAGFSGPSMAISRHISVLALQ